MPKDYEHIRDSYRKQHPNMPLSEVKKHAARITNAKRKKAGKPAARYHVNKRKK